MLFLQLTLTADATAFTPSPWIAHIKTAYPGAAVMEADNHSDVYLYQQILKWLLQSDEPLALHVQCSDSEAPTGPLFRFLQDLLQKKMPASITLLGTHTGMEKYVRAFAEYTVVESVEEAVGLIGLRRKAEGWAHSLT